MAFQNPAVVLSMRGLTTPVQHVIRLKPGEYIIGRDPTCDIVIPDPYVSRKHAKIFYRDGKWYIEDLGSRNGTYVNGEQVKGVVELKEGTEILIGFSALIVKGFELEKG